MTKGLQNSGFLRQITMIHSLFISEAASQPPWKGIG
jgi:hypothetical protein